MSSKTSEVATEGRLCLNPLIQRHTPSIRALAQEYGVERLEVFGSVCTSDWNPESSDIDFLVEYPPDYDFGPWIGRLFDLERALSDVLGRKVDLVMTSALRNPYFDREAAKTRKVLYDASKNTKVAPRH